MTKSQRQERRQQWQQWIGDYRSSGLSAREWCASHDVSPHRLWYWLRRFRTEEEAGQPTWLQVDVSVPKANRQAGGLVVKVGKADIEVQPGFDPELLLAVVRVLLAAC